MLSTQLWASSNSVLRVAAARVAVQQPLEGLARQDLFAVGLVRLPQVEERIVDELAAGVVALERFEDLDRAHLIAALVCLAPFEELTLGARALDVFLLAARAKPEREPERQPGCSARPTLPEARHHF
jgi:hypothetical protein